MSGQDINLQSVQSASPIEQEGDIPSVLGTVDSTVYRLGINVRDRGLSSTEKCEPTTCQPDCVQDCIPLPPPLPCTHNKIEDWTRSYASWNTLGVHAFSAMCVGATAFSVLVLNGCLSVLSVNSVLSLLSINSFMSVNSINGFFSVNCIDKRFAVCNY
jgi:hypothetical protein